MTSNFHAIIPVSSVLVDFCRIFLSYIISKSLRYFHIYIERLCYQRVPWYKICATCIIGYFSFTLELCAVIGILKACAITWLLWVHILALRWYRTYSDLHGRSLLSYALFSFIGVCYIRNIFSSLYWSFELSWTHCFVKVWHCFVERWHYHSAQYYYWGFAVL